MASSFLKDPNAVEDFVWDWKAKTNSDGASDWLEAGETITSHTITPPAGITVDSSYLTDSDTSVTAWLSGGTALQDYSIICHIATSNVPRTDDRTITIKVRER